MRMISDDLAAEDRTGQPEEQRRFHIWPEHKINLKKDSKVKVEENKYKGIPQDVLDYIDNLYK